MSELIEKLNIRVTNIGFENRRGSETTTVNIHFVGDDPDNEVNINGIIKSTVDEYNEVSGIVGLSDLVKQKVTEKLQSE